MAGERQKARGSTTGHRIERGLDIVSADEPAFIVPKPPKPRNDQRDEIGPEALDVWERFWRSPVARAVDINSDWERLVRWITAIDLRYRLSSIIARSPMVQGSVRHVSIDEETGKPVVSFNLRPNPALSVERELTREIEQAEQHFGMTPLSRFRLGIEYAEAADAWERMAAEMSEDGAEHLSEVSEAELLQMMDGELADQ